MKTANATNMATNMATDAANTAGVASTDDILLALGSDILHWFEPRSELVVLNGSNVSRNHDVRETDFVTPTLAYLNQSTAGNQPAWNASGFGANSTPYVNLQDAARYMLGTISVSAGHRTGHIVVGSCAGGASSAMLSWVSGNAGHVRQNASKFNFRGNFTGGTQNIVVTSPALDNSPHLFASLPYAAGAVCQIDGVTTTPSYTGTDTLGAWVDVSYGHNSVSGGNVAMVLLVANIDTTKMTVVESYVAARFGI